MLQQLTWIPLVALLAAFGGLAGALVAHVVARRGGGWFSTVEPEARFRLLWMLALAPVLFAAAAVSVAFAPSVLHAAGIVADHCSHHVHHPFHLCFVHGTAPSSLGAWVVAVAVAVPLSRGLAVEVMRAVRATRWKGQFSSVARYCPDRDIWLFASSRQFAFTLGVFTPRVFVSTALLEELSATHARAIAAHERAHARRRDSLAKAIIRAVRWTHLAETAAWLADELELAAEQACDEAAARSVADRLTVAEAIVQAARSMTRPPLRPLESFGSGDLEERVRGLLDAPPAKFPTSALIGLPAAAVGLVVAFYQPLHHGAESVLALLF